MDNRESDYSHKELLGKVKALMLIRVIFLTLSLGVVVIIQKRSGEIPALLSISFLIGFTYFLTLLYAILLRIIRNLLLFSYIQIVGDVLITAGLTYVTGGVQSIFSFLYMLAIITASLIISRKGGYVIASFSSIVYGVMANLELYNLLPKTPFYGKVFSSLDPGYVFYLVFFNILAFFLTAFLSGILAERLKLTTTELKREKNHFSKLQSFTKNIVDSMGSGLFATDIEGKINFYNNSAESLSGYKKEEVMGRPYYEVFHFPNLPRLLPDLSQKSIYPNRFEGVFKRRDKKEIFLGMSLYLLRDESDVTQGVIGIFRDLTVLKEMEEKVRRKDRLTALGEMAAGIAHEIRNPLTSISGSVQLLKESSDLNETDRQLMDIVVRETEGLNSIITNFLAYARPLPLVLSSCDINEIVKETIRLFKNSKEYRSDIEISTSFEKEKIYAKVDAKQVRQVFWNLCINSVQAMPKGGVLKIESRYCSDGEMDKIHLKKSKKGESPDKFLEINISDNGMGISKEELNKIFDPFYTSKEEGSGLGLATVHRIIEDHSGAIDVKSELGGGTCFRIFLPAV